MLMSRPEDQSTLARLFPETVTRVVGGGGRDGPCLATRLAGVGAHSFHPDAEDVPVIRQQPRRVGMKAGAVRAVGTDV